MADERQEPGNEPADRADDRTAALPPQPGDTAAVPPAGADATSALPPAGGDRTAALPPAGGDRTAALPPTSGDRTAALPPTAGGAPAASGSDRGPAWSGRAGVPPPRPAAAGSPPEWGGGEYYEQSDRRWWMPILVGVVALILIGVLIFGGWLILQSTGDGDAPPAPSPSPTASPTPRPTSAAPTTASPTPEQTTPASVPMPPLVGLPRQAATDLLDGLSIDYQVRLRPSNRPAGTVIETDPAAGEPVAEGEPVILVVAEAASPEPGPTGPSTSAGPDPND
jgi:hypothetical protein